MLYACIGSHRSGKTTTAKAVAEQLGLEFLDSSFNVARQFGFDPVGHMKLEDRFTMQEAVLNHHLKEISAAPRPLVTDRTPLDYFAYLTAEYGMMSHLRAPDGLLEAAANLAERCLHAAAEQYDMVFLLDPLPVYEVDETKATPNPNPMFQLHIEALIHGALSRLDHRMNYAIVPVQPLQARLDFICEQICERMDDIDALRKCAGMH